MRSHLLRVTCALAVASSQPSVAVVQVIDDQGTAVAHAVVVARGAAPMVANDSGRVVMRVNAGVPLDLWVRRIGYHPYSGAIRPDSGTGRYVVRLDAVARRLDAVIVEALAETPLARTGFYDRVERVRNGAIVAEFITPEELDSRSASQTSDHLRGRRYVRVYPGIHGKILLTGRGGCAMTILVDGRRANGTAQDIITESSGPQSIVRGGTYVDPKAKTQEGQRMLPSIDELVGARDVMAIEVYSSMANAPAELVQLTGGGSCGIVAIWTGPRR